MSSSKLSQLSTASAKAALGQARASLAIRGPTLSLWRNIAYTCAAACFALGTWGLIGGWYFGLPIGGELRESPYEHSWSFADFWTTIPDPALAKVPLTPGALEESGGRLVRIFDAREKMQPTLRWHNAPIVAKRPQSLMPNTSSRDTEQAFAQQRRSVQAVDRARSEPWMTYTSGLATAKRVVIYESLVTDRSQCLSLPSATGSVCVPLSSELLERMPVFIPADRFSRVEALSTIYFDIDGQETASETSPAVVGFVETEVNHTQAPFFTATIGDDIDATVKVPVVWLGGYDRIFKVVLRPGGGVSVTSQVIPFLPELILFASMKRGWVYARFEREGLGFPAILETHDGGLTWRSLSYRWLPAPWVFAAFLAGIFAFERGTRIQLRMRPVDQDTHVTDHGVSDNPIGMDDGDALGLYPIAMAMSRFLRNVETKPTVAFAITGPWGSGKSSLMNIVREDLVDRGVATVWFNAWHYQKEDSLLAALLTAIRHQAIPPVWTSAGITYRIRVGFRRIIRDPARALVFMVVAVFAAILLMRYGSHLADGLRDYLNAPAQNDGPKEGTPDSFRTLLTSLGLSTTGLGGLIIAVKKLFDLFKPLKSLPGDLLASLSTTTNKTALEHQLSFRDRFASEFSNFCEVLRWPPYPGLVLFIDDLDRCEPKQVVDVLEAINFVTNAGKCFVIMGFDEGRVKAAIADRYKDVILKIDNVSSGKPEPEEVFQFASRYLEKLVHLVIAVPRSGREAVGRLLGVESLHIPDRRERRLARWRRTLVESTVAVIFSAAFLAGAWLAVDVAFRAASQLMVADRVQLSGQPNASAAKARDAGPVPGVATPATPVRSATDFSTQESIANSGLLSDTAWSDFPASVPVGAFVLMVGLIGVQFIPRLFLIEPVVNDSPEFKRAMSIWVDAIAQRRETPRDVKRFINRIRFLAMRQRDLEHAASQSGSVVPLDEAQIVSFAAIEDLDQSSLGKTLDDMNDTGPGPQHIKHGTIVNGLRRYKAEFGRDLYVKEDALALFRQLGGLVEERGGSGPKSPSRQGVGGASY